ncbi:conserved hypothetical protein, membrane [Candidatus Magnetomorum sp. HK-1]|nr:conserved hypothetical protein, membrane [Candidatus Magnetomorum sp. HK-1]
MKMKLITLLFVVGILLVNMYTAFSAEMKPVLFNNFKKTTNNCTYFGKVTIDNGQGEIASVDLEDEVGVFVSDNKDGVILVGGCVIGSMVAKHYFINVYADDSKTPKKDGAYSNEKLIFKIWDKSESKDNYTIFMLSQAYKGTTKPSVPPVWAQSTSFGFLHLSAKTNLAPDDGVLTSGENEKTVHTKNNKTDFIEKITIRDHPPALISPNNGKELFKGFDYTINWSHVSGAKYYEILIDNNSGFGSPEVNTIVQKNMFILTATIQKKLHYNKYFWKIRGLGSDKRQITNFSNVRYFVLYRDDPVIKVLPYEGKRGTVFNLFGSGFSKNTFASLYLISPDKKNEEIIEIKISNNGTYKYSWSSKPDSMSGMYNSFLVNNETGIKSNTVTFIVWIDSLPQNQQFGILARTVNNPRIYLIKNNKKFLIVSDFVFKNLGYSYSDIQWYGPLAINSISEAKFRETEFINSKKYLIDSIKNGFKNFQGANFQGIHLERANLESANLERANFKGAFLTKANLKKANLRGANLEDAILSEANLEGANFEGANLIRTILSGANLEGANFEKAIIKEVNFFGANLIGTTLEKAYSNTKIIENMDDAVTAYSVPKSMILKETELVNLIIDLKKTEKELVNMLIEKKTNGLKVSNFKFESDELKASSKMKATLNGSYFEIEKISEEIQAMTLNDVTEWKWQIKALKEGRQSLHLSITAIFEIDGKEEKKTFRSYDRIIEVIVKNKIKFFFSNNWYWIALVITTITAIFTAWLTVFLTNKKKHKQKKKEEESKLIIVSQ